MRKMQRNLDAMGKQVINDFKVAKDQYLKTETAEVAPLP